MKTHHRKTRAHNSIQEISAAQDEDPSFGSSADSHIDFKADLESAVSYVKENWKIILSEVVAAGVTAFLEHQAKNRNLKTKGAAQNH